VRRLRGLLVLVCLWGLAACQSLPFAEEGVLPPTATAAEGSPERAALNARVYDAATDWIATHYYDPAFNGRDWPALAAAARERAVAQPTEPGFYAELSALVDGLGDRHTAVTSPTARARLEAARTGRSAAGYGFSVTRRGERFFVTQVRPDSPAAEAGVKIGWRLVRVNGSDAFRSINPQEGRVDSFVFEDERGDEQRLTIAGRVLEPRPRQQAERRADGVLVLRFDGFDRIGGDWMKAQVEAALADPPRAIILDLRDNPGGLAAVLGDVVALFFEGRTDFMVLDGRFIDKVLHNTPARQVWTGPVAVLVGPGSGSASELLAALMQETKRGLVAGQTSAGAVIGSRPVNLPDGGELSLSLSAVRTGQGRRLLEGAGVTPDIVVEPGLEDLRAGRDPALEAAVAAVAPQAAGT
jgi:carboxyl-terminal processing protease